MEMCLLDCFFKVICGDTSGVVSKRENAIWFHRQNADPSGRLGNEDQFFYTPACLSVAILYLNLRLLQDLL